MGKVITILVHHFKGNDQILSVRILYEIHVDQGAPYWHGTRISNKGKYGKSDIFG